MPTIPNLDPCGNPIPPLSFDPLDFAPKVFSPTELLALIAKLTGVALPAIEFPTPCPMLKDAAKRVGGS